MSSIYCPYDPHHAGGGCSCGRHASEAEHSVQADLETQSNDVVEEALLRAMFPVDSVRRTFLRAIGANTVRAAIASVTAKVKNKMTWADIAEKIGNTKEWTTAAMLGQMTLSAQQAGVAGNCFPSPMKKLPGCRSCPTKARCQRQCRPTR